MKMYILGWIIATLFILMWALAEFGGLSLGIVLVRADGTITTTIIFPDISPTAARIIIILALVAIIWEILPRNTQDKAIDKLKNKIKNMHSQYRKHIEGVSNGRD